MEQCSLGWCPDIPDLRDWTLPVEIKTELPSRIDLREGEFAPLPESRNAIAHASCAISLLNLLDWQSRKWEGERVDGAVEFLHQLTQETLGGGGTLGVGLRSTLKTLKRFGTPPSQLCESPNTRPVTANPRFFGYGDAFKEIRYYRLDSWSQAPSSWLWNMKRWLWGGSPFLIGFAVPRNFSMHSRAISFDVSRGGTLGGTACVVMGFDDNFPVAEYAGETTGAFLARTCWGPDWGDRGFIWLPYAYVESRFARDAWAVDNR